MVKISFWVLVFCLISSIVFSNVKFKYDIIKIDASNVETPIDISRPVRLAGGERVRIDIANEVKTFFYVYRINSNGEVFQDFPKEVIKDENRWTGIGIKNIPSTNGWTGSDFKGADIFIIASVSRQQNLEKLSNDYEKVKKFNNKITQNAKKKLIDEINRLIRNQAGDQAEKPTSTAGVTRSQIGIGPGEEKGIKVDGVTIYGKTFRVDY